MKQENNRVVCFGEVLWDNLPEGRKPGGAPMNVAYHLNQLGIESNIVSRVGDDQHGKDLKSFIDGKGIPVQFIQKDTEYKTSEVAVHISEDKEVSYEIMYPVAWDFISSDSQVEQMVKQADAFVYGSLSARAEMTSNTLYRLLENASYKVFDINLRPPFIDQEKLEKLLQMADLLKLNKQELELIAGWYNLENRTERQKTSFLLDRFDIKEMIVTKGSSGASFYNGSKEIHKNAYKVVIQDTIGSGDAFLSGFIVARLNGKSEEEALEYATAIGGFVTMNIGACPSYSPLEIESFIQQNQENII
ncbi:MAG: carbohydrate kinase [Pedobacter sp.]|uniref:carbohydrate kinase family protein n=1 Tax=Pedobacter sp. TaxID=1411316 RepID=UPI003567F703